MTDEPRQGVVRSAVVWDVVSSVLARLDQSAEADLISVVDLGGGTGGLAVRIAELGHRVVVIDPSPDALASLHRRAVEHGVADRIRAVQGDAADLGQHVPDGGSHLVLCHGVLEVVDDPADALAAIRRALRPDGLVSVLVAGRLSAVLSRALAGDFARAQHILQTAASQWDASDGPRRYTVEEIGALVERLFTLERTDAIRVFADLVPSAVIDTEPGARQHLLDLERAVASRAEFATVAAQHHLLARAGA